MEGADVFGGTHGFLPKTCVTARFFQSADRIVRKNRISSNLTLVLKLILFSRRIAENNATSKNFVKYMNEYEISTF